MADPATDQDLLAAWRGGDASAGDALVARYWDPIARFFRHKIGDDGADLISATFVACVESAAPIASVRAFLFAVARRRLVDHFRARGRAPEADVLASSLADLATGPVTELDRRQRADWLRRALARIPLDDQILLELAYLEAVPHDELAGILDVAANTVRSRLSRARDKLRAALAEIAPPGEAELAESQLGP